MIANQPQRPANMRNIVAINQGLRPLTLDEPSCPTLSPAAVQELLRDNNQVLDTRSPEEFGEGHIAGAANLQVSSSQFEQRSGWLLPDEGGVVLVAETPGAAQKAIRKLAFVGLDQRVRGQVETSAWAAAGLPIATLAQMTVEQLSAGLAAGNLRVLDVREASEWRGGHVASALHMNFKHLPQQFGDLPLGRDDRLAVICATGMRSSTACSFLLRHGFHNLLNVTGGMMAWKQAGFPATD
jgi:hydroxyacylglutathione hydrolase